MKQLIEIAKKVARKVASEPLVALGVVFAAVNAVQGGPWYGYVGAGLVAFFRTFVSPVIKP